MSAEEFIYSVINTDNVAQLDLNVIANTLASADSLIRQIKAQQVENEGLKEKIISLRSSALQIKQLYEAELGKNQGIVDREEDYVRQIKELEARAAAAENAKINAELQDKEIVADLEKKVEHWRSKCDGLSLDMVKNCSLLADNGLLSADQQVKYREWKWHVQTMAQDGKEVPEDVMVCVNKKRPSRKKRKSEVDYRDQATMTSGPSYSSIGINAVEEKPVSTTSSTCTENLEAHAPQYSITDDIFPEDESKKETPPQKTFADKSTMYSSATVTRSTCTSAFIKRVDVGVNFPEVVSKSISEILRECVIELPSLLTPILDEIPVHKESTSTQTDPPDPSELTELSKPAVVTVGTNTNLRNIRRKVDYVRKADGSLVNNLLSFIKKEENTSPVGSLHNLPAAVFQSESADMSGGGVNPQLTHIWGLLGETMFRLLGTGRMYDSQCYSIINERIAMINNLIDSESSRGTAMLGEVFAAAAASASVVSDRTEEAPAKKSGEQKGTVDREPPVSRGKCMEEYEEEAVGILDEEEMEPNDEESNVLWDDRASKSDEAVEPNDEEVRDEQTQTGELLSENQVCDSDVERPEISLANDANDVPSVTTLTVAHCIQTKENLASPSSPGVHTAPLVPDKSKTSIEASALHTDESNDFCSLMQPTECDDGSIENNSETCVNDELQQQQPDEESDEIANELRQMEEDVPCKPLDRLQPCLIRVRPLEQVETKRYLNVVCEDESAHTTDDEGDNRMTIVETSPTRSTASSSCTSIGSNGTLISPIKVKETNELVKDQFKTPTSPAISKRKLRERLEGGPSKRGRLSPTTESLLEDDWDHKFSHIKNYFTLPSSVNPILEGSGKNRVAQEYSELDDLWNFGDDDSDNEEGDFVVPNNQLLQPLRLETSSETGVAISDSPESPTEELPPTCNTSWNDFKRPLSIDIGEHLTPGPTISNTPDPSVFLNDSPMSPVADGLAEIDSIRSFSQDESPLSPSLESRVSMYSEAKEPRLIPLENPLVNRILTEASNNPIGKAIGCYSTQRRAEVLQKLSSEPSQLQKERMRPLTKVIKAYLKGEWTVKNLDIHCEQLLNISRDSKTISQVIVDCVAFYKGNLEVDVQCSPPAPPLPRVTQQLVLLAKTLNETLFILDRAIVQEVDRRVFNLKSEKSDMEAVTAMTYLYIGVADCNRLYGCTARMYIYKCLYYFKFKGLPLIYYVLKAFPHALPKKASAYYDNSDAMVSTIRTVLMNTNFMDNSRLIPDVALYKKSELQKLLKYFYGYQTGSPTYEELITNLIEKIKANKLKNVDYCLILVAKRQGYDWAKVHIVHKHLYPLLNDYLKQIESDQGAHDDQLRCLIFAISAILKTQPNYQDITGVMQIFGSIVQRTDGHQRVQEAAVAGLMRFSRFDYADIYEWLCKWCPKYAISGRIKLMLATFVHRKEGSFWKHLSQRKYV